MFRVEPGGEPGDHAKKSMENVVTPCVSRHPWLTRPSANGTGGQTIKSAKMFVYRSTNASLAMLCMIGKWGLGGKETGIPEPSKIIPDSESIGNVRNDAEGI